MKTLRLAVKIDNEGKLGISGTNDLQLFQKNNKGSDGILELTILDTGDTKKMQGYFYAYVIKELKEGLYDLGYMYNDKETEKHMIEMFPFTDIEETIRDYTRDKLYMFIGFCMHYAAKNLCKYINDPITARIRYVAI